MTNKEVIIRNAREEDIMQIADIQINGWKTAYKGIIDDNYLNSLNREAKIKQLKVNYKQEGFIVAVIEEEIVGFCKYTYNNIHSKEIRNIDGEICALYVKTDFKRKGIGAKLFKHTICDFKKNGNKKIILWCLKENMASRKFYEKMGGILSEEKEIEIDGTNYNEVGYIYNINLVYNNLKRNKAYLELKLVFPTLEYKEQIMEYLKEHLENNEYRLHGCGGLDKIKDFDKWIKRINNDLSEKTVEENRVPATLFLGVRKLDNKVIGMIQIRHKLNIKLLKNGGHIGDGIRPSERGKGYATEMIRLALEECKKLGIKRALMVCYKDNIGSSKSIKNNGGILENEVLDDNGKIEQRYWISLKKRFAIDINKKDNIIQVEQKMKTFKDKEFNGDIYLNYFIKLKEKHIINNNLCIQDDNYKWLQFYDYNSKVCLTTVYNEENKIIEWYFDIARSIGKENNIPYEDDLYLDVVLKQNGETILLDEDELREALNRYEITEYEFEEAYKIANNLINKVKENATKVKEFTDRYLRQMI